MNPAMEGLVKFNLISDNPFWEELRQAQAFHVSARDRYTDLLALCKSKGVKFTDIKKHLLNEAKKCGLYTRSLWSDTQKTMVYRAWSDLLQCRYSWVIALNNFLSWVHNNFKDYDVKKNRIAGKHKPSIKKDTVIRRTTGADGAVSETRTETIVQTEAVSAASASAPVETVAPSGIVAPVTQDLTVLQIQTIIMQNLNVLGTLCSQKGDDVKRAYNTLMLMLECPEFVVE